MVRIRDISVHTGVRKNVAADKNVLLHFISWLMYRQICSIGEIFKLWSADQVGAAKNMGEVRESVLKIVISLTLYDFSTNRL